MNLHFARVTAKLMIFGMATGTATGATAQAPSAQAPSARVPAARAPAALSPYPSLSPPVEREAYAMGTRLGARVRAGSAVEAAELAEAAFRAVRSTEALLSTWRPDTELSRLNAAPSGAAHEVSSELASVLREVDVWVGATGGAFDPSIGSLIDAWQLRGEGRLPPAAVLAAAREASGWEQVTVASDADEVTRAAEGLWIDAGGFGKGLALRRAVAALEGSGASAFLNFGGQVVVVGSTPETVGVADAGRRDRPVLELALANASAATTSTSERHVEVDGVRYGHVLDPRTGRPAPGWGSVTVVAEDPFVADVLSTALYVMGPEAALEWSWDRPYGVVIQRLDGGEPRWNPALERWLDDEPEAAPAPAGPGGTAQDTSEIERLKRQVEAITRELERMRLGGDVVEEADTSVLGFGPAASKIYKVDRGVSIGGYGEILFEVFDDELEDGTASPVPNEWDAYRAILYFGYKFNDRLLFNSEIELEHADEASLEFAYLDYRLHEGFGLRGGLLLSPMGLVNELHEPPVFLGSTRPMVETRIIPTTWRENGFGVFGDVGPIAYRAYVLNGLAGADSFGAGGLRGGRQKGSHALAEDVAGVVRVDYGGVLGLRLGGSVYYGGSGQGAELDGEEIQANTLIWEGHATYQAAGLDLRALVAGAAVDEAERINAYQGLTGAASVGERLAGGYAHVGYDVLRGVATTHQLIPYVRYEWLDTQAEVPAGYEADPATDRTAVLLGAAWKPVPQVAIKGDYQIHSTAADTGRNEFALVLSYLF